MGCSTQVTQNGNTTLNWTISGGGGGNAISNNDVMTLQLDNSGTANTGVQISNIVGFINPNRYSMNVTVVGPDAVAFRFVYTPLTCA
jgi:hypothetical protein